MAQFLRDHPNVAGVQAFHNAAGMILRGPGHPSRQGEYPPEDEQVASEIGRVGARMLPFYRSLVIHRDLYNVHGGFVGWTYEHLGIFSFTNELWNNDQLLGRSDPVGPGQTLARAVGATDQADQLFANDRLLFGAQFLPWTKVVHPVYGEIEIGGLREAVATGTAVIPARGTLPPQRRVRRLPRRSDAPARMGRAQGPAPERLGRAGRLHGDGLGQEHAEHTHQGATGGQPEARSTRSVRDRRVGSWSLLVEESF